MGLTVRDLKKIVIKSEVEWLIGIHGAQDAIEMYIPGMLDDMRGRKTIADVADFYISKGVPKDNAYQGLIALMLSSFSKN